MDTNVIGRLKIRGQTEPERPRIRVILTRDLSPGSHGNACGLGLADITTRRLVDKVELDRRLSNVLTTGFLERGKIPLIADTDRQALEMAQRALGITTLAEARIVRIHNTRFFLEDCLVSPRVADALAGNAQITILGPVEASLGNEGQLEPDSW